MRLALPSRSARAAALSVLLAMSAAVAASEGEDPYRRGPPLWPRGTVVGATVLASGLGDADRDRIHDLEPCSSFRPTGAEVARYFRRARRIGKIAYLHETTWSACHATGRLRLRNGTAGDWMVRRGGSGSVTIGPRTVWFDCEVCLDGIGSARRR